MQKEHCFCGDRVGVLVQANVIPDSDKDAKKERHLLYNVDEIIHIGVNQATYLASKEKIQVEDKLKKIPLDKENGGYEGYSKTYQKEISRFIKEFIGNRGIIIHPDNPVYVERIKNEVTPEVLKDEEAFCLYHVTLRTLRFANEIVVDITANNIQTLFWLGAAHGAEVYAITVKQELSPKEQEIISGGADVKGRNVFDVAGLWTAYYYSHDTEGFYHQLALAQFGIEKHSKIIPSDKNWQGFKKWEYLKLHETEDDENESSRDEDQNKRKENPQENRRKRLALESYYRRRFWNTMLQYNRLCIYVSQRNDQDSNDQDLRLRIVKWDLDAISALSNYLSKRSVIGEYNITILPDKLEEMQDSNYICVGQPEKPQELKLSYYINEKMKRFGGKNPNLVHKHFTYKRINLECSKGEIQVRGFVQGNDEEGGVYTYLPWPACTECSSPNEKLYDRFFKRFDKDNVIEERCPLEGYTSHIEIAQLILWRDDPQGDKNKNRQYFRVSVIGGSGPATCGLSSIFVDEEQKREDFMFDESDLDYQNALLYKLQERVRKKIFDLLLNELEEELKSKLVAVQGDKGNRYIKLVLFSVYSYLKTVLYRYFLPFLTEKDIECIYNGTFMCLNSMKVAKQSPFCLDFKSSEKEKSSCPIIDNATVEEIVKIIPAHVKNVLERFVGVEAFYKVKVEHASQVRDKDSEKKDTRKIKGIAMIDDDDEEQVNCFVLSRGEERES